MKKILVTLLFVFMILQVSVIGNAAEYESVTGDATAYRCTKASVAGDPTNGSRMFDGDYTNPLGAGEAGKDAYIYADLGVGGKRVDKVVITAYDKHQRTKGMRFYLADTTPIPGADTSGWKLLGTATNYAVSLDDPNAVNTFVLSAEQAGIWRYIVVDFYGSSNVGGYVYEIEAYKKLTSGTDEYSWTTLSYNQDGTEFSVAGTGFVSTSGGTCKFIAAAYDSVGNLIDAKLQDISLEANVSTTINAEVDFAGENYVDDIALVKTMFWNSFESLYPIAKSGEFNVPIPTYDSSTQTYSSLTNGFYEAITPTQAFSVRFGTSYDATTGTSNWSAYETKFTPNHDVNKIYDNSLETSIAYWPEANKYSVLTWEVLAGNEAVQVDRVVAYTYEKHLRTKGTEFYLHNANPYLSGSERTEAKIKSTYAQFDSSVQNGDVYYLGKQETTPANADAPGAKLVFDVPESAGTFKYVSAKNGALSGGPLQELRAYKKVKRSIAID